MDPLSVAASITGLLTASVEVAKLFAALTGAYDYAQTVHDEIHHFRFILFRLDKYIQSDSLNITRASMIDLDQVVTVLVGCVCTFSELEREVKRLQSWPESLRRVRWSVAKSNLVDLVQRIQNHKGTICSMFTILTSETQDAALNGMNELRREVAELLRINAEMARKLDLSTAGSSGASVIGSVITGRSVQSFSSARTNFQTALTQSRVYRRALLDRVSKPRPAMEQSSASSIKQSWSVLSGLSLSEISNYSAYSLPITPDELYNPTWYMKSDKTITLEPTLPEVPVLLTPGFVESLKIALKQDDVEVAKTIANYIPWHIVLEMSAVYPTLSVGPSNDPGEVLDRFTLFRLWLQCGGNTVTRDSGGRTAIERAFQATDSELFMLVAQNGSDINTRWSSWYSNGESMNALDLVSGRYGEWLVNGLCGGIEAKDRAEIVPIGGSMGCKRACAAKLLLKLGADINAQDKKGQAALHHASECGNHEVAQILLGYGADTGVKDKLGKTALHRATECGHDSLVKALLSHGADVNAKSKLNKTALHLATECGDESLVKVLLRHGADIDAKGELDNTALHRAIQLRNQKVAQILLGHGADIEVRDRLERTALHCATECGHESLVKLLLRYGADVNAKRELNKTALHGAAERGNQEVAQTLLCHGADTEVKDKFGMTALHRATEFGHESLVKFLLSHGADIDAKDGSDNTALHLATQLGNREIAQVLLGHGADIEVRDRLERTALHCATECGHESLVFVLLRHGADVNAKRELNKTALHGAAERGNQEVAQTLLDHGADTEVKDKFEMTALHRATELGHESLVEALLSHGADVNAQDQSNKTALHWAAGRGRQLVVKGPLSHGADVDIQDRSLKTAPFYAMEGKHGDVIHLLQ